MKTKTTSEDVVKWNAKLEIIGFMFKLKHHSSVCIFSWPWQSRIQWVAEPVQLPDQARVPLSRPPDKGEKGIPPSRHTHTHTQTHTSQTHILYIKNILPLRVTLSGLVLTYPLLWPWRLVRRRFQFHWWRSGTCAGTWSACWLSNREGGSRRDGCRQTGLVGYLR